ncbi:MAG: hypothetical protein GY765_33195 [bacterium]|nr:hypothetical protein [bacterium]
MISRFKYNYTIRDAFYSLSKVKRKALSAAPLTEFFGTERIYFSNLARTGLRLLLTSLNLKENARVGVQAYTCHTVLQSIAKAGCTPCFIDLGDDYNIDHDDLKKKISQLDVLVVNHTFGIPADMDKLKQIAANIPIIEDCAHSLFATYKGKQTGTIGDAAVFSFGHAKYPSIGKGGFTVINNEKLDAAFKENLEKLEPNGTVAEIKNIVINFIWAFAYTKFLYSLLTFPVVKKLDKKIDFLDKFTFKESAGFHSNVALLLNKFPYYLTRDEKQHRNGQYFVEHLKNSAGFENTVTCLGDTPDKRVNYYLFPLRSPRRDEVVADLLKKGIESGKHFHKSLEWAKEYGYVEGDCPNCEKIVNEIFTIPSYYSLKPQHLDKIIGALRESGHDIY